jgi:hypothetical protein
MTNLFIVAVFLAAAFPTAAVLLGILIHRQDFANLRTEFRTDLDAIRSEIVNSRSNWPRRDVQHDSSAKR